ncbi:unnamed protein product [Dibothriocephalus latus]|uniref:RING-type domain-containing protein n=1 Tax=Dibothriocephalus latus TaxID=60516 RepID=A0A3P7LQ12_DIBLA|nr:unnamed protein product [Dibothriocephalus latus]
MLSPSLELVCNYRKCKQNLREIAVVTICQHILCIIHSPKPLNGQHIAVCPVCDCRLDRSVNDYIEIDLQPSDRFKSLILAGQSPEVIFDICSRALSFYNFQQMLRLQFLEYVAAKSVEKTKAMEKEFKTVLSQMKEENMLIEHKKGALLQECEELRSKLIVSDQKLTQLEKECQRLRLTEGKASVSVMNETNLLNVSLIQPRKNIGSIWGPEPKRNRVDTTESSLIADNLESMKSHSKQDDSVNAKFGIIQRDRKPSPFRFVTTGHGQVERQVASANSFVCKSPAGLERFGFTYIFRIWGLQASAIQRILLHTKFKSLNRRSFDYCFFENYLVFSIFSTSPFYTDFVRDLSLAVFAFPLQC